MSGHGPAFTLAEILLALLFTSCVVTLGGAVAVQMAQSGRAVNRKLDQTWRRAQLARRFAEDVDQRITWPSGKPDNFAVNTEKALMDVISLAPRSHPDAVTSRRCPARIMYVLEEDPENGSGFRLVRSVDDLTSTGPIESQLIAEGLLGARVEIFTGGQWSSSFEERPKEREVEFEAVRLVCIWATDNPPQEWSRTVLIRDPLVTKDNRP